MTDKRRFTVLFRRSQCRAATRDIDAVDLASLRVDTSGVHPSDYWVEHVIDWDNRQIHAVTRHQDGRLMRVKSNNDLFGELTPIDFFESRELIDEFRPTDKEII